MFILVLKIYKIKRAANAALLILLRIFKNRNFRKELKVSLI